MQENLQRLEDTQTTIRALLLSAKNGLTLRQLENDYSELEGERIPWKDLGYSSLLSFLQNMPSVVQITNKNNTLILNGIASNKSKHVHKLVSGQKQQKFESVRRKFRPSSYFPRTAPMRIRLPATVLSKVIALVKKHPNGINKHEVFQIIQLSMPFCQISIEDMEAQLSELSHKLYLAGNKIYFVCSKVDDHDDISHKSKSILHKQQRKISPIMMPAGSEDFSHTIDCDKIDLESRPSTNVSLPMFTKPTTSVKPMSNTISKYTEQESGKTWPTCNDEESLSDLFCYDSLKANQIGNEFNDNGLNEEEYLMTNKGVEILINERVKMRLQNLIQNHPNGIWCADLPQKYLDEYKVPLNYLDLGFNSMRDFASHLPEIFHCFQPHDGGDFILFSAKREIPLGEIPKKQKITNLASFRYTYTRSDEEPFPTDLSHNTCKELIPDEVMAIGDCVQHIKITDLVQSEKLYIEVVVVEVFTPSFFWVQLYDKQKMFNQFMEDLHYFYISKHMQYGIPSVVLEEGLNCACIYNGLWHRGIIKAVKPDQQVTVMFYDYGTLKTYPSDAVYYLHKMFSYLPSQAIPCGLVNIRPCIGSKWSCSTTHHFALRTADIPLIAMIASVNTEDNSMMITLTDTSQEEDIHINDWLVEQKHAQHGKMGYKVDMSNIMQYVEENLLFAPEKCYAMEDSNNISENLMNVPLITPKSTLKYTFPTSSIKDKVVQDQLEYSKLLNNNNTNSFLQNEPSNNRLEMDVSQPNLLQLWHENLQLQMQITNILGVLLSKVNTDSTIHESNKVNVDKDLLTAIKNVLLLSYKRRPPAENSTSTSSTDGNSTVYNGNGYETKSAILNKDFFNVVKPTKHFSDPTVNQQPFATTSYGNRQDFSNYFHCVKNDNEKSVTNLSTKSGKRVKQTNPFKCDFDFELESWNDSALNSLNSSSTFSSFENGSDKPKDENDILKSCNESSIHQTRNIFTETSTNSNSVKNNSFSFCNESFNCSASIDDVATSVANIVINENHLKYSSPEEKPYYLQQRTRSFIDSNVFENHKEHKLNSSSNSSNCISLLPFTGSLESPTLGNNTNIFKEHLVSPSAFSTMFDLPSLRQTIKEEGSNDISMIKNLSSTDTVCVGMENNSSKNIVPKKNCDSVQQSICNISLVSSDMLNLNTTRDNLAVTNPYLENSGMRSVRAGTEDLQCLHPLAKVFLQTVELPKQMIHVFHYDNKGWLLIDEFVEVYTEFKTTVYMINLLHVLNVHAEFIEIDRHNNLVEIVTSSRFLPNITQKLLTESNELRLMSLRTALQVLYKLENISREDIESFRYENSVSGSVKHMVWLTINAYKQLRYKVENAEQFYSVNLRILRHYNVL